MDISALLRPAVRSSLTRWRLVVQRRWYAYPKEGLFQPNSPPWNPTTVEAPASYGYGRQPPPGNIPPSASLPRQFPQPNPQQQFRPEPDYEPQSRFGPGLKTALRWTGRIVRFTIYLYAFSEAFDSFRITIMELFTMPFEPDSPEDQETLKELTLEYEDLHEVQILRNARYFKDGAMVPRYREWVAYKGLAKWGGRRAERLTTGPLAGSGGVAAQSIFVDDLTGAVLCLINFGEATCQEIPGQVHNGVISTIFDEVLARVAIRSSGKDSAVTAKLNVEFLEPCQPGQWYCVFARSDGLGKNTENKKYVQGTMWCTGEYDPERTSMLTGYESSQMSSIEKSLLEAIPHANLSGRRDSRLRSEKNDEGGEHTHAIGKALFVIPKENVQLAKLEEEF